MADNRIVIATIGREAYLTRLDDGVHTVYADEPVDVGGKDAAPGPGDYMRMSLASCTAITLRMYATRKGFDVDEIKVEVRTEDSEGKTTFHRQIHLTGNLDNHQRTRMLKIANSCPVHKVLTNPIAVNTVINS